MGWRQGMGHFARALRRQRRQRATQMAAPQRLGGGVWGWARGGGGGQRGAVRAQGARRSMPWWRAAVPPRRHFHLAAAGALLCSRRETSSSPSGSRIRSASCSPFSVACMRCRGGCMGRGGCRGRVKRARRREERAGRRGVRVRRVARGASLQRRGVVAQVLVAGALVMQHRCELYRRLLTPLEQLARLLRHPQCLAVPLQPVECHTRASHDLREQPRLLGRGA